LNNRGKSALEANEQMLLAVAGEGSVGKTRVIQAVELGFELLAAYNIGGRTIHTALSIDVFDRARPTIKPQTYSLWQGKTTLFIDEISMVSLTMLNTINQQCNRIRAVGKDSTAILGALPIVIFMGDFHQFAPIKAQPLWQTPKNPRASFGQLIWHRFTDVVIWTNRCGSMMTWSFRPSFTSQSGNQTFWRVEYCCGVILFWDCYQGLILG
jgi:hypothetical protein